MEEVFELVVRAILWLLRVIAEFVFGPLVEMLAEGGLDIAGRVLRFVRRHLLPIATVAAIAVAAWQVDELVDALGSG